MEPTLDLRDLFFGVHSKYMNQNPSRAAFHCAIIVTLTLRSKLNLIDLGIALTHPFLRQAACSPSTNSYCMLRQEQSKYFNFQHLVMPRFELIRRYI